MKRHRIGRIAAAALAILIALAAAGGALAQESLEEAIAQIEALWEELRYANDRIDELEAAIDRLYEGRPPEGGDDGEPRVVAWVAGEPMYASELMPIYEQYASLYAMYGITDAETLSMLKRDIVDSFVSERVLAWKAAELGIGEPSEAELVEIHARAEALFWEQVDEYYEEYLYGHDEWYGLSEEEARAEVARELEAEGYGIGYFERQLIEEYARDRLYEVAIESVGLTGEELAAYYEERVIEDQAAYAPESIRDEAERAEAMADFDPSRFESDMLEGATPAFVPAGYRRVRQILVQPDEEDADRKYELESELSDINIAIQNGVASDEDKTLKPVIEAELFVIEEKFRQEVAAVMAEVRAGADFMELIDRYGTDGGMTVEPTRTTGYYVSARSTMWDRVFTEAAMALEAPGDVGEPAFGAYGAYIIRYEADVEPGRVSLESIEGALREQAERELREAAYTGALEAWYAEAGVEVYYENMR